MGGGRLGTGVKKGWLVGGREEGGWKGGWKGGGTEEDGDDDEGRREEVGEEGRVRTFCIEWGGM